MGESSHTFAINDIFLRNKELEDKLHAYTKNENYSFTCINLKKLNRVKNLPEGCNKDLIYDERYFRCSVNRKPVYIKEVYNVTPKVCIF